jgi:hypothetical protein
MATRKQHGFFGEAFRAMLEQELKRVGPRPSGPPPAPRPRSADEVEWGNMTDDQKCLAYGRAVLAEAKHRDKVFPRERNESNTRYDMYVTWAHAEGRRR